MRRLDARRQAHAQTGGQRQQAHEREAHGDDDDSRDLLHLGPVALECPAERADQHAERHEHQREAEHEAHGGGATRAVVRMPPRSRSARAIPLTAVR